MAVGRLVPPPSLPTEIARMTLAHLPAATSLDSIYPFVCQLAAAALKVERVGIWFLEDNVKRNTLGWNHLRREQNFFLRRLTSASTVVAS